MANIAEQRRRQVYKLAEFKTKDPTPEDYKEASTAMNSYYRLCGLCERNLYLTNDSQTADCSSTKRSEEKERRWYLRLGKIFKDIYGLDLVYNGYLPEIGILGDRGEFYEKISTFFYN